MTKNQTMAVTIENELQLDAEMAEATPTASTGSPETIFLQPNVVEASDSEAVEEDPLSSSVTQKVTKLEPEDPPGSDEEKNTKVEPNEQPEMLDSVENSIQNREIQSPDLEPVPKETVTGRIKVVPLSKISDAIELRENEETGVELDQVEIKVEKTVESEFKIKDEVTDEDVLNGLNALESCFENSPENFLDGLIDSSEDVKDKVRIKEESQLEEGEIPPRAEELETIDQMSKDEKLQLIYSEKVQF